MSRSATHLPRLTISLLLVLGVHIGLGILALNWQVKAVAVELPPAAILIELPPQPAVAPPPAPAVIQQPTPEPEVVVAPKPKLVLEKPKPKPKPKPVVKQVKPAPTPPTPAAKPVEQATPTATTAPAAAPVAQQPSTSSATLAAKATWQSQLLSHLARHKRYPDEARRRGIEGTSQVRFNLDRAGGVLSVELAKSSGNAALDRATLAMIRRASPVPAPPAELLNNGQLEIVAPFIYALERR
ncbi:MAG: energy transducer TonB [Pseudomonas sp.]|uniref:energy transducer TonB n=1 Tax=Pseudomonas sp. TaxID=306 RepID=UPI002737256C|nr:energy transducer TonB [Pseudomonas sp.]MDP3846948.1 energy transducer TonB [Pseudomonas sp.]